MKTCPKCAAGNVDAAMYCVSCGSLLAGAETPHIERPTPAGGAVPHNMVSTTFELYGYNVVRNLGLVRGIVVRSRSILGTMGAGLQTLVGGDITLFSNLCESTREDAFDRMLQHAADLGANAVVGVRYDATEVMQSVTEVLAYGTAVVVEPKA